MAERTIDDIAHRIARNKETNAGCVVLIGAGCSITAGIPSATGIVEEIRKRHPREYASAAGKTYPDCMAELAPGDCHKLINEFIEGAKINWAHIHLARLMKAGHVDRVLTTNFDPLVVRACALFNLFPAVYDMMAMPAFRGGRVAERSVFHLHGQRDGFFQAHRTEDVNRLERSLRPLFEDSARRRTWIVVGYSGDNDPVFRQLSRLREFDDNLYWVGYKDNPLSDHAARLVDRCHGAHWIKGQDADGFFLNLAQAMNCPEPSFFEQPFSHMKKVLSEVAGFDQADEKVISPVAMRALEKITRAIDCIEPHDGCPAAAPVPASGATAPPAPALPQSPERADTELRSKVSMLSLSDNAEAIIALRDAILADDDPATVGSLAWAYVRTGVEIKKKACASSDSTEADKLFAEAIQCYRDALTIKPDMHSALNNWGIALDQQARRKSSEEADRLWAEAFDKYHQALAIKPDKHEALFNWGTSLGELARRKNGDESDHLWAEAFDKYRQALAIKPDKHEALNNWGAALAEQAHRRGGEEAGHLWAEAINKYRQAVAIKPEMHEALFNWGNALDQQARRKGGDEADRLWDEAKGKFAGVNALVPGKGSYGLACIAALRGNLPECRQWLEDSRTQGRLPERAHMDSDADLDPVRGEPWFQDILAAAK